MKKLIFAWLLGFALPMTLAAANTLPQLTFTADEARLKQFYDEVKKAYDDPDITFISDDAKMQPGTERERMMVRLLQCTCSFTDEERYTLFEWAQLNTKIIQQVYFTNKKKTTDLTRIERFADVKQTTERILNSIEDMAAGSQMEMNGYSYVGNAIDLYLAVLKCWMTTHTPIRDAAGNTSPLPEKVREALAKENDAWWELLGAAVLYYDECATNGEWYSMKPLEDAWVVDLMCERRQASLDLRTGYLLPDSPEAKTLQAYDGKVTGDEKALMQYLMDKSKQLTDNTAEYDNGEQREEARQAARRLNEAWETFLNSQYNVAASIRNAGLPTVIHGAFIYDAGLYIDTLLTINQEQAWE